MRNKKKVFPIVKSAKTFSHRKRSFRTLSCPHKGTVRLRCIMKKGWFLPSAMSLLITYFVNLNLKKEIIVLEKSLETFSNFESENLYQPCIRQWSLVNSSSLSLCFLHRNKEVTSLYSPHKLQVFAQCSRMAFGEVLQTPDLANVSQCSIWS